MVELTEEQRKQIVDAAAESIRATAIKDATERLSHYIQDTVHSTINEEVTAVLKAEIVPLVQAEIIANKPVLVEAAVLAAHDMAAMLRDAMVNTLTKKLADNWSRKAVLETFFK